MENLNYDQIIKALKEGRAFFRCIRNPHIFSLDSAYSETNAQKEIRKIMRKKNEPTKTKDSGTINGNPLRSVTLAGYNAMTFSFVGFGIINPNIENIIDVFKSDCAIGFGKRKETALNKYDYGIQRNILEKLIKLNNEKRTPEDIEKIKSSLDELRNWVKNKRTSYYESPSVSRPIKVCNEVIMNIKKENIDFIFFTSTNNVLSADSVENNSQIKEVMAIYLQRELKKHYNKDFPIINYDNVKEDISKYTYDSEKLNTILKVAFDKLTPDDLLGLYKNFKEEITSDIYLYDKATQMAREILYSELNNSSPFSKILLASDFIEEFLGKDKKHMFFELNSHAILRLSEKNINDSLKLDKYIRYINELVKIGYSDDIINKIDVLKLTLSNIGVKNIDSINDYQKTLNSINKLGPEITVKLYEKSDLTQFDFTELFDQRALVESIKKRNLKLTNHILENANVKSLNKKDSETILLACIFDENKELLNKILSSDIKLDSEGMSFALKCAKRNGLDEITDMLLMKDTDKNHHTLNLDNPMTNSKNRDILQLP